MSYDKGYLSAQVGNKSVRIGKLSKSCMESIDEWGQKGYTLCKAETRFVVAWKGQEDTEESAVLLPSITLINNSQQ